MDYKLSDDYTFLFERPEDHRNLTNIEKKAEKMKFVQLLMTSKFCIYSCGF